MKVAPPIKQESGSRSNAPRPFPTVHIIRFYHRAELADRTQTTHDPIFGLSELQEREEGREEIVGAVCKAVKERTFTRGRKRQGHPRRKLERRRLSSSCLCSYTKV